MVPAGYLDCDYGGGNTMSTTCPRGR